MEKEPNDYIYLTKKEPNGSSGAHFFLAPDPVSIVSVHLHCETHRQPIFQSHPLFQGRAEVQNFWLSSLSSPWLVYSGCFTKSYQHPVQFIRLLCSDQYSSHFSCVRLFLRHLIDKGSPCSTPAEPTRRRRVQPAGYSPWPLSYRCRVPQYFRPQSFQEPFSPWLQRPLQSFLALR